MNIDLSKKLNQNELAQVSQSLDLDMEVVLDLKKVFARYDSKNIGFIQWYEVDDVYRDLDIEITEEYRKFIKDYLDGKRMRGADFMTTCEIYKEILRLIEKELDEIENADYINAFCAMGGNPDRTGFVTREYLVNTIKNIFDLTFDIEKFLETHELQQEELDFKQFMTLFGSSDDGKSLISYFSRSRNENNG